jgi:transcriptional regulator with XRE-family HTH domain
MNIGDKIRKIASSKGVSAQELGNRVDRTRQGIYDIYNSRVSVSVDLLLKIAEALKEPIVYFFIDDPEAYYDMIPQVIPIREILKHMKQVHEHAIRGEGMVNLRIFRTKDGMYILESEFHELKDELTEPEIEKFDQLIDESFKVCSK